MPAKTSDTEQSSAFSTFYEILETEALVRGV